MIFVDTSALTALLLPDDKNHSCAVRWVKESCAQEKITTDYIVDELYTVLLSRTKNKSWTIDIINKFRSSNWINNLIFVTQSDFALSEQLFLTVKDKGWSFTDCTCKIVMQRLNISEAFAFDEHFKQFGSVTVLPI